MADVALGDSTLERLWRLRRIRLIDSAPNDIPQMVSDSADDRYSKALTDRLSLRFIGLCATKRYSRKR